MKNIPQHILNQVLALRKRKKNALSAYSRSNLDKWLLLAKTHHNEITSLIIGNAWAGVEYAAVPNTDNLILANERGELFSVFKNKFINGYLDKDGYIVTSVRINGGLKKCKIHRLIAETFLPNPDNKPQVNHLDFDKSNNAKHNLAWATSKEDAEHKVKNNRQAKGKSFPQRKGVKLNRTGKYRKKQKLNQ